LDDTETAVMEQQPVVHAQLTADDFDDDGEDFEEPEDSQTMLGGLLSLAQRVVDVPQGDDADKYDFADDFSELTADELVESNEQAYDG